jgi:hypothetical protein
MGAFQDIEETIEVVADFRAGAMKPLRFRWRGRTHEVARVTGRWRTQVGRYTQYFFTLLGESGDQFEIALDSRTLLWRLVRIGLDG